MAYIKLCDACGKLLGDEIFLQFQLSVSEQDERNASDVRFRYLTFMANQRLSVCDWKCLEAWGTEQAKDKVFKNREEWAHGKTSYPQN